MSDAYEPVEAGPEPDSALEPSPAPQAEMAPEESAADLDTGLDLGLAGAGLPAADRFSRQPPLPPALQARAIGRVQRQQGNFAAQRMLQRSGGSQMPPKPVQPFRRGQQRLEAASEDDDWLAQRIEDASGGGKPIEPQAQARLAAGLHDDLSGVRVHTDAEAGELAGAVDAVAFTSGRDIFFGPGTYQPDTSQGLELLAHEAVHTVQQAAGPVAGTEAAGGIMLSDPADPFERAAENLGDAMTHSPPPSGQVPSLAPGMPPAGSQSVQRTDAAKKEEEEDELHKPPPAPLPPELEKLKKPEELL